MSTYIHIQQHRYTINAKLTHCANQQISLCDRICGKWLLGPSHLEAIHLEMQPPKLGGIKLFTAGPLVGGCSSLQPLTDSQVLSPVIPSCPPGEVPVMVGWHLPSLPDLPAPSLTHLHSCSFLKDKGSVCPTPSSAVPPLLQTEQNLGHFGVWSHLSLCPVLLF